MIQDLHQRTDSPGLGVIRAVHQTLDAGMHQGTGAHRARFNCNKHFAVPKTVVTNSGPGFTQGDDLGVSGGVGVGNVAIPATAHDVTITHDYCAHRDFSSF
jgi:hypothetical protein